MREITQEVARRYLLGRQGLWPGRRWQGKEGAAEALRALGAVQMDPVSVIHRSHDLVLLSRVVDYQPVLLDQLLYSERRFFDYGAHLDIYPMAELPYWRQHMVRRAKEVQDHVRVRGYEQMLDQVLEEIQVRGPLCSRDIVDDRRVNSYRSQKGSGVALYLLWLSGVMMTHSRKGIERRYDLTERIAPSDLLWQADEAAVAAWSELAALEKEGLCTPTAWGQHVRYRRHGVSWSAAERARATERLLARQEAVAIKVEGCPGTYLVPASAEPLIDQLAQDAAPEAWRALPGESSPHMTFLSPLDNLVHDRRRLVQLFAFDYLWEIYTLADSRRYGPYTLPILYGDRLVGRIDLRLDRAKKHLIVNGVWWEDPRQASGQPFRLAFGRCLESFMEAHRAESVIRQDG